VLGVTALAAAVGALSEKLARLEKLEISCPGDWVRLDAAVTRTVLAARDELQDAPPEALDREALCDLLDQLRYIKLCTESHLLLQR